MTARRFLRLACPTAWAVCLVAGFLVSGKAAGALLVAPVWLAWVWARRWPAALWFAASVGLAASGVAVGVSAFFTLPAAALALASWDLAHWDDFLAGHLAPGFERRLNQTHALSLVLALVPALLAALAGRFVQLSLPFGVLLGMAVLAFLALNRLWAWVNARP